MKPILALVVIAAVVLLFGVIYVFMQQAPPAVKPTPTPAPTAVPSATSVLPGGDRDSHGCIPSAGYTWCEAKNKCIRTWEENCTESLDGGDRDEHGCIPSAGYTWCARKQECVRIWEEGCLRVLTEDYPPYNFRAANGTITGACTEVVQAIAKSVNHNISIELVPLSVAYNAALNESDVLVFSLARTGQRESLFKWVGPVSPPEREVVYVPSNTYVAVTSWEDARGLASICVYRNDFRAQKLEQENFTNLVYGLDDADCVKQLANTSVQAWIGNERVLSQIVAANNLSLSDFRSTNFTVIENSFYIAFSKDVSNESIQLWQERLDEMKQNGTYTATMQRYGLGG